MPDIEERAARWADDRPETHALETDGYTREDLIAAYLAGSAQTQKDYTANA